MGAVATGSFATRVATRLSVGFVVLIATLVASLAIASPSRAATTDDFATALVDNPFEPAGIVHAAALPVASASTNARQYRLRFVGSASGKSRLMRVSAVLAGEGGSPMNGPEIRLLTETLGLETEDEGGEYSVRVFDGAGNLLKSLNVHPQQISNGASWITAKVDFPADARSVSIWRGSEMLAERVGSSAPPAIRIDAPATRESWMPGNRYRVAWTLDDPDGPTSEFEVFGGYRGTRVGPFQPTSLLAIGPGDFQLAASELVPSPLSHLIGLESAQGG